MWPKNRAAAEKSNPRLFDSGCCFSLPIKWGDVNRPLPLCVPDLVLHLKREPESRSVPERLTQALSHFHRYCTPPVNQGRQCLTPNTEMVGQLGDARIQRRQNGLSQYFARVRRRKR